MSDTDEISEIKADIQRIKDNHLFHIEKDMNAVKIEVAVISERLKAVETFQDDIKDFIKVYAQRTMALMVAASGASVGVIGMM
ncbi:MAG: hypothetical protein CMA72_08235 [Euryarchaeota archaeon]|jgi:hypothetical protein|nr:hypothetical protein [Euryarchaeota archaeon]|tara:strand:+ start:2976 stop:3224 length:249 start_codon:yes stop_codon:yes gene_type:complete